jgi:hypothetical protein
MKNHKTWILGATVIAGLSLSVAASKAQIINSGASLSSLAQITTSSANYSDSSGLDGTLVSTVYSGVNGLTQGGLTFVYTLSESGGASDNVDGLSLTGFKGTTYTVYYESSAGGVSAGGTYTVGSSGIITMNFASNLTPGSAYQQVVIYDSDPNYAPNLAGVIDSSAANAADLAPAPLPSPVPEASTIVAGASMLLPLGIGALRTLRKERTA